MARSEDNLPGLGRKTLAPRLRGDAPLGQLRLSPGEGYVLSRIDGRTTLWEVCLLSPLPREETLRILRRMRATGIIEVPGSTEPVPPLEEVAPAPEVRKAEPPRAEPPRAEPPKEEPASMSPASHSEMELHLFSSDPPRQSGAEVEVILFPERTSPASRPESEASGDTATSQPHSMRSEVSGAAAIRSGPRPLRGPLVHDEGEPQDLSAEQRQRIDEVYGQINIVDAFTLLGVAQDVSKKDLQRAYYKLSKEFHPDRYFKKQIGYYRQRVAAIFQAITEARDTLIDDEKRATYLSGGTE